MSTQTHEGGEHRPETIRYAASSCSLGAVLVAESRKGVCAVLLADDEPRGETELAARFPGAILVRDPDGLVGVLADIRGTVDEGRSFERPLDLRGTTFEQTVWDALRAVPAGTTVSYGELAARIGAPRDAYAVGTACAANPVAVVVPCHRVVRKDGSLAGYRWGFRRKHALLKREAA